MKKTVIAALIIFLSISAGSQVPVRISPDLELIRISDNAYMHVSYSTLPAFGRVSANGLVLIDNKQAFLFDTPWNDSLTSELVNYLRNKMNLRIIGFIPNHWHEDCMGGLSYLKSQNIRSYANQRTIEIAKNKKLPVPDQGFKDSLKLALGERDILCYFMGSAHSLDNIVVWLPSEKILFAGCMCKSMESENPGNVADGDLSAYPWTIDRVIQKFRHAKVVIPGHGSIGGPELLIHTKFLIDNY
ncbi:MAG: subclass B1 metallo-beta-lactamase [Chloroflexota bacterium]